MDALTAVFILSFFPSHAINNLMSALMVGKQNPLHEVRRFMRQKDLRIVRCGSRQRRFIGVQIVCGVRDLYPKGYTNVRETTIRFEQGWKGNLFCFITTFTIFTESYVSQRLSFFTCALISVDSLLNEVDLHKWYYFTHLIMHNCFKPNQRACTNSGSFFSMVVDHLIT